MFTIDFGAKDVALMEELSRCMVAVGVSPQGDNKGFWLGDGVDAMDITANINTKEGRDVLCNAYNKSTITALKTTVTPFAILGTGDGTGTPDPTDVMSAEFRIYVMDMFFKLRMQGLKFDGFIGFFADGKPYRVYKYADSTFIPTAVGGPGADNVLNMPIDITFGKAPVIGTADSAPSDGTLGFTFTPPVAPAMAGASPRTARYAPVSE